MKEVEIIEAYVMPDHIHMLVRIPPKMSVSSFMGYFKGRSATLIHEQHANLKYKYGNKSFWSKGYYVSTVGLNQKTIEKYIREQEAEDRIRDSISKREYVDSLKNKIKIRVNSVGDIKSKKYIDKIFLIKKLPINNVCVFFV